MSTVRREAALTEVTPATPANEVRQLVADEGAVIIKGLLTTEQVTRMNEEIDPYFAESPAGFTAGTDVDARIAKGMARFFGHNTKRITNTVTISPTFRDVLLDDDWIHEITGAVLSPFYDDYWLAGGQFIEVGPHSPAQPLHRDIGWSWFESHGPAAPDVIINFFLALDDFTDENGATRVIPGSHLWPDFGVRPTQEQTVPAVMDPGDALLLGGKTLHGAGANVTDDRRRRALGYGYKIGLLTPEEAFPFMVDIELARTLSPRAQRVLGFRSLKNYSHFGGAMWQVDYRELADYLKLDEP